MSAEAFWPQGPSVAVTANATTSVNVQLNGGAAIGTHDVLVSNLNALWAFVVFGLSNDLAVFPTSGNVGTIGVPIPPNGQVVVRGVDAFTTAAAVSQATAAAQIIFTPGEGTN